MINELEFKSLSLQDLESLMGIDAEAFSEPWSKALWKKELTRPNRLYHGAFHQCELIGFAGGLIVEQDFHITTIATVLSLRSKGIGTLVLSGLLRALFEHKETIDGVTLEVRASNVSAKTLYNKFGFAPVGIRRGYYQSDGEDALIMWLHGIRNTSFKEKLGRIEDEILKRVPTKGSTT